MPSSIWQFGNLHVDLTQVARLFNLLFCFFHIWVVLVHEPEGQILAIGTMSGDYILSSIFHEGIYL